MLLLQPGVVTVSAAAASLTRRWRLVWRCGRGCRAAAGRGNVVRRDGALEIVVEGEEKVVSLTGSLRAVDDPLGVEAEVMTARDVGVALMDTPR